MRKPISKTNLMHSKFSNLPRLVGKTIKKRIPLKGRMTHTRRKQQHQNNNLVKAAKTKRQAGKVQKTTRRITLNKQMSFKLKIIIITKMTYKLSFNRIKKREIILMIRKKGEERNKKMMLRKTMMMMNMKMAIDNNKTKREKKEIIILIFTAQVAVSSRE